MTAYSADQATLQQMISLAEERLAAANLNLNAGFYRDATSRAYYAAFHAISAVLAVNGLVVKSHAQTIGAFNRDMVKTGVFPRTTTRQLQRLFINRQRADYDLAFLVGEVQAREDIDGARVIVDQCTDYLASR